MVLDADHIIGRYWLGSYPWDGPPNEFPLLVLCAREAQRPIEGYQGTIIRGGFDDDFNPANLLAAKKLAAKTIEWCTRNDGNVLVTCMAGLNRSALTLGLILRANGMPAGDVASLIRIVRKGSLCNPVFHEWVRDERT